MARLGLPIIGCMLILLFATGRGWTDERRAPRPKYSDKELENIFFEDLSAAFGGKRPTLSAIRKSATAAANVAAAKPSVNGGEANRDDDVWGAMISPVSIEDEVKRIKLHYDSVVTTPGAFNSGGYMDARLDLTVLAMMFGVINEHAGEVRWKEEAATARDLLARTAFNCKAGSTQVFNEARLRKADLQDLVSGAGLSARDAESENDWSMIVDRSPLMEYLDALIDSLEDASVDEKSVNANSDRIKRQAELVAVVGEVLTKEGLDDADDADYVEMSRNMSKASRSAIASLERGDSDGVRKNVSAIRQRCDVCHEQYR